LITDYRHSLFVADSETIGCSFFDIDSWQLVDIWGNSILEETRNPLPNRELSIPVVAGS